MIEGIEWILISVCLINDYSLIAYLHIFVYGHTECASISLECTKVKLSILDNFGTIGEQAEVQTTRCTYSSFYFMGGFINNFHIKFFEHQKALIQHLLPFFFTTK